MVVDAEVLSVKEKYSSLNTYGGNYKTNPLFFEIILLCIFEISHNQNFIAYLYLRVYTVNIYRKVIGIV